MEPADDALVQRCLAHDEEAWAILLDRYAGYIYAIATRGFRLGPQEAEEVLQETALSLVQHLPSYRGRGPLRAWIGAVAANAARQYLRRRRPTREVLTPIEAADLPDETILERAEEVLTVQAALQRLPEECRMVLEQAFHQQRQYAEIASALGIPQGTVASRIARCLLRLRRLLEPEEEISPRREENRSGRHLKE